MVALRCPTGPRETSRPPAPHMTAPTTTKTVLRALAKQRKMSEKLARESHEAVDKVDNHTRRIKAYFELETGALAADVRAQRKLVDGRIRLLLLLRDKPNVDDPDPDHQLVSFDDGITHADVAVLDRLPYWIRLKEVSTFFGQYKPMHIKIRLITYPGDTKPMVHAMVRFEEGERSAAVLHYLRATEKDENSQPRHVSVAYPKK